MQISQYEARQCLKKVISFSLTGISKYDELVKREIMFDKNPDRHKIKI